MTESPSSNEKFSSVTLTVKNIGGINRTELTLKPGVSVLAGRNATNRTSLLSALGSVLGGTTASLKSDAEEGHISLEMNGGEYTRNFYRTSSSIQISGDPYSENSDLVDLFTTLFENNSARQAVKRGEDLRDVIMRPVDTKAIQSRISELQRRKQDIESELKKVKQHQSKLPSLERSKKDLTDEIEEINSELEVLQAEVVDYEADIEAAEEASEVVVELNTSRQELSSLLDELEVKQAERDALEDDIAHLESELGDLPEEPTDKLATVEDNLNSTRQQKQELDNTIASLTTIVDFNERLLTEGADLPGIETNTDDVTSELAPENQQKVNCWTCGSKVQRAEIDARLDDLRKIIQEKRQTRDELEGRLKTLQNQKEDYEERKTRRTALEQRLEDMNDKKIMRDEAIKALRTDRDQLEDEIEQLERKVAETEELRETGLLEKYEQISNLQYERGQLKQQLNDTTDEINKVESLPIPKDLKSQRNDIQSELDTERTRIAAIEDEAVNAFNHHMNELLDTLEYENISRVWIERKTEGDHQVDHAGSEFELHIVRETKSGSGYEDHVDNLSESEREVVGLVVALAGYLVHEVYEEIPFILLDSLEAIDAQRIEKLITYFATYAPYLIVALLPEDSTSLKEDYDRITADVSGV